MQSILDNGSILLDLLKMQLQPYQPIFSSLTVIFFVITVISLLLMLLLRKNNFPTLPVHLNYHLAPCAWCSRHNGKDRYWWWLNRRCSVCNGRGMVPVVDLGKCRYCEGRGHTRFLLMMRRCQSCHGSGQAGYIKETDSEYIISWGG